MGCPLPLPAAARGDWRQGPSLFRSGYPLDEGDQLALIQNGEGRYE